MTLSPYKIPESVLVVIYAIQPKQILMLKRKDDQSFWQSVTGSLEQDERAEQAAIREVLEETGIDIRVQKLHLIDVLKVVKYDIFPFFRHRYAPGTRKNKEHWFYLPLATARSVVLSEHIAYQWLPIPAAIALTKSETNASAISYLQVL